VAIVLAPATTLSLRPFKDVAADVKFEASPELVIVFLTLLTSVVAALLLRSISAIL
jgi:hypothetical protein